MFFSLKPIIILALTLTAVASPITNPIVEETNILVTRAQKKDVDCNGQKFTVADINNALRQAKVVEKAKEDGATDYDGYPKVNNNHENLFSSTSALYEYPLVSGTFSGKNGVHPGLYRVIMNEKYNYMGSVYHVAGVSNAFKKCTNVESPSTTTTTTTATAKVTTKASSSKTGSTSGNKSGSKSGKKSSTKSSSH
ncbi:uncharacterized protein BO87DRAFT_430387 [Aspergillus neoniger CBS 115656]|uniref:Uncharacterized protein n=1 Tax=Aspergillus neoniger (strain CBS 115656) TaxID=1448310 RepID=A0A318Y6U5_ASPNB|nr:hypothetical protein BO87DRAFT_430387 [Aspergillus neoniger CBS 115656]PYH29604.1 hypothetical protein BO87DRAFT_430387 [Aspergillus neoniger CBS 115656]